MSSLINAGSNKNKPTFESASKIEPKRETNVDTNTHTTNTIESLVDSVINQPKGKPKTQISVYLDTEVAKAFNRFGKQNGKGSKSELVNSFLKKALDIE